LKSGTDPAILLHGHNLGLVETEYEIDNVRYRECSGHRVL